MRLEREGSQVIHLSHLHRYVSAYETNKTTLEDLEQDIQIALLEAKQHGPVIVQQDCLEHIFIVFPSGTIGLYRLVGNYEVYNG
jgi:hypothetical protein